MKQAVESRDIVAIAGDRSGKKSRNALRDKFSPSDRFAVEYSSVARSSSFAHMPREISLLFRFYN